jgi:kynurenine formamidase
MADVVDDERSLKLLGSELSNWARWGADDELGTVNYITPKCRVEAAALVRTGEVIDLGMPLDAHGPQPTPGGWRHNPIHQMTMLLTDGGWPGGMMIADDTVILPLQAATQWDALAHCGYDGLMYNGVDAAAVTASGGATKNSMDKVATRLVGRGVLLDIARLRGVSRLGPDDEISAADLDRACESQAVTVGTGDILLVRTGWYQHFSNGDSASYMATHVPGLDVSCCRWLHERQVAAVAADTFSVEIKPSRVSPVTHPLHMVLIRDMGMTLGEMFNLEELAPACAREGRYEFFFSGVGLKVTNSVGNALTPIVIL